ncbi:TIGR04282 family arsenosugar biosynthesis glycosyltransferase [Tuberibacillus sp. Marseille-P3662]|uniref:TIGR04282 family arsenosugar biosynthesis glycosyltransferase n=1 Tax=Tuberibacillus sp. Marseille-P3662 TaxID=1965358 RepID=UPI00159497DA|nr:TIGR04282 family arsenosugar biosynthesis glycosyltransferase [Tuberibacillus sp. Marseille-P3662]
MVEQAIGKQAVLILAKVPIPGFCKTRLQPDFTAAQCASLQKALLKDMLSLKEELEPDIHVWMAYTPEKYAAYFRAYSSRVFPQQGVDLGERMRHGLLSLLEKAYQSVLIIGTDTPLYKEDIYQALAQLNNHPVVIGPANDGGYYLLGLTRDVPQLFTDISWGTSCVFAETMRRVRQLDLRASLLDTKRDIDHPDDLRRYYTIKTHRYLDQWKDQHLKPYMKRRGLL